MVLRETEKIIRGVIQKVKVENPIMAKAKAEERKAKRPQAHREAEKVAKAKERAKIKTLLKAVLVFRERDLQQGKRMQIFSRP